MFDVSFSELLVIAVVALLVIGPEKLPKVARFVGTFVGRMQRYKAQIAEEVNREMRFEELQKLQQEIKSSVENAVDENVVKPFKREKAALHASILVANEDAEINSALTKLNKINKPTLKTTAKLSPAKLTPEKATKAKSTLAKPTENKQSAKQKIPKKVNPKASSKALIDAN